MKKIAIVGPESSGKTTLCGELATHFGAPWVPEFAREYLGAREGRYNEGDLLNIAKGQCAAEEEALRSRPQLLLCDTDLVTIRIWSEEKFGRCDPGIVWLTEERPYDHWLLCRPDIPWEFDPLRENPQDRDRLFSVYEAMLLKLAKPCTIIEGDRAQRMRLAIASIEALSGSSG